METTSEEKNRLRTIIGHLLSGDMEWFAHENIVVGDKNLFWMLNYNQFNNRFDKSRTINEYNSLLRGMVVAKPTTGWEDDPLHLIKSFPFTRFFNQNQSHAAEINFSNADMLEKLDGTFVCTFFPNGNPNDPYWQTRQMLSIADQHKSMRAFNGIVYKFIPLIGVDVKKLSFEPSDVDITYMFEWIHHASQVVTQYPEEAFGLYLIGARRLSNHKELSEDELDAAAEKLGVRRCRRWDTTDSHDEILAMMKKSLKNPEGFVFRDRETGKRIKVKDPDYVARHHVIDMGNFRSLAPLFLKGETDEVVAHFPHAGPRVTRIEAQYEKFIAEATEKVATWLDIGFARHELAEIIKDEGENSLVFNTVFVCFPAASREQIKEEVEKALYKICVGDGEGHNLGNPRKFLNLLGFSAADGG